MDTALGAQALGLQVSHYITHGLWWTTWSIDRISGRKQTKSGNLPHSKSFLNPFPPRHLCSQQYVFPPLPLLRARGRALQFGKIIIPMLCLLCIFTDDTLLRNLKPMPKDCYAETLGIPKRLLRTQKLKTRTPVTTRITPVGGRSRSTRSAYSMDGILHFRRGVL